MSLKALQVLLTLAAPKNGALEGPQTIQCITDSGPSLCHRRAIGPARPLVRPRAAGFGEDEASNHR